MAVRRRRGKERLLDGARHSFANQGFHATGIEALIANAGVAKMTLYNNYASKEALVVAVLEHTSDRVLNWLEREIDCRRGGPGEKLLSLFDIFEGWFAEDEFSGCLFGRAAREYPASDHPAHMAAHAHLKRMFTRIEELASDAGVPDPSSVAQQILILLQGATTVAEISGATIAARRGKHVAELLIARRA